MIAAAHVSTIKRFGPDRVVGFSPIPAMSPASYAAGTRFLSLIGGVILSFYDWYADLPPSSPQTFGDQTDVPESADWWNAGYLLIWGTNLPTTRTPDAHFMVEARYRGQKVVVVSPDYAEHVKFADHWLPAQPGTDGALAMAMGHVILKEFYVDRQVPYFVGYARQFTDLPLLVTLRERDDGFVPDRFLRASDLGAGEESPEWKPALHRRAHRRARRARRLGGAPLRPGRRGPLEPRAGWDRAAAEPARPWRRRRAGGPAALRRGGDRGRHRDAPRRAHPAARRPPRDDGLRSAAGPVRRGTPRAAGRVARGLRRPRPSHPRLAGGHHLGRTPRGGPGGARVRAQRRAHRGPVDDLHGRGHQPLVPLRPDLPHLPLPGDDVRLRGTQRRRLGPLRGSGEGAPADGLADPGVRPRLDAATAPPVGHAVLLPRHRAVALRAHPTGGPRVTARARAPARSPHRRRQRARRAAGLAAVVPELRPQLARPGR